MENLRLAYHLNGVEVQQVWMCLLGPDWYLVKGAYSPTAADGTTVLAADSADLKTPVDELIKRIKEKYKRKANYTEIGRCKQKTGETFDEYRVRMEKVFKAHSGLDYDDDETKPYKQQLKNALHSGSLPEIQGWVNRHYISMSGGTLTEYINHALHAEKVIKQKKEKKEQVFYQDHDESAAFYQKGRGRGRGRGGRSRGRGRSMGPFPYPFPNSKGCWSCGKEGHQARDCTGGAPQNNA